MISEAAALLRALSDRRHSPLYIFSELISFDFYVLFHFLGHISPSYLFMSPGYNGRGGDDNSSTRNKNGQGPHDNTPREKAYTSFRESVPAETSGCSQKKVEYGECHTHPPSM